MFAKIISDADNGFTAANVQEPLFVRKRVVWPLSSFSKDPFWAKSAPLLPALNPSVLLNSHLLIRDRQSTA